MGGKGSGRRKREYFTEREHDLLALLGRGERAKEIAILQRTTLRATQELMQRLKLKLNARTTAQMTAEAVRKGIIL